MSAFTRTSVALMADNASDHEPVIFPKEVLDLSRDDWALIVHALRSNDFYFDKAARGLAKDIEAEILANLSEVAL